MFFSISIPLLMLFLLLKEEKEILLKNPPFQSFFGIFP
jgi:hypothetical protein